MTELKNGLPSTLTAISAVSLFAKFAWASEYQEATTAYIARTLVMETHLKGDAEKLRWEGRMDSGPMGGLFALRRKLDQFGNTYVGHKLVRDGTAEEGR